MPKSPLFLFLPLAFLLTSCSAAGSEDIADNIQNRYSSTSAIDMTVSLDADYGDKLYSFTLDCNIAPDGGEIVIIEPESVAGVTARIENDGVTLSYDGAEVYTGAILPKGLSPVDAPPVMAKTWREGLITETVSESFGDTPCISVTYRIDDNVNMKTWFSKETYLPVHAEFSSDGYTVILCDFKNVTLE